MSLQLDLDSILCMCWKLAKHLLLELWTRNFFVLLKKNSYMDPVWGLFFVCVNMSYLKIGYGVWGGEPCSAGVLLVAERSVECLGDGAQIEGTDSWSWYAVPEGGVVIVTLAIQRERKWEGKRGSLRKHGQFFLFFGSTPWQANWLWHIKSNDIINEHHSHVSGEDAIDQVLLW